MKISYLQIFFEHIGSHDFFWGNFVDRVLSKKIQFSTLKIFITFLRFILKIKFTLITTENPY